VFILYVETAEEAANTIVTVHRPIAILSPVLIAVPRRVEEVWTDIIVKPGRICTKPPVTRPVILRFVVKRPWMNQDTGKTFAVTTPSATAQN